MRHVGEQYWRSLLPALRRNQRPQFCAGHLAHVMMPVASQANCCQMASINSLGRHVIAIARSLSAVRRNGAMARRSV
jgi:hypothetical protein